MFVWKELGPHLRECFFIFILLVGYIIVTKRWYLKCESRFICLSIPCKNSRWTDKGVRQRCISSRWHQFFTAQMRWRSADNCTHTLSHTDRNICLFERGCELSFIWHESGLCVGDLNNVFYAASNFERFVKRTGLYQKHVPRADGSNWYISIRTVKCVLCHDFGRLGKSESCSMP